ATADEAPAVEIVEHIIDQLRANNCGPARHCARAEYSDASEHDGFHRERRRYPSYRAEFGPWQSIVSCCLRHSAMQSDLWAVPSGYACRSALRPFTCKRCALKESSSSA